MYVFDVAVNIERPAFKRGRGEDVIYSFKLDSRKHMSVPELIGKYGYPTIVTFPEIALSASTYSCKPFAFSGPK